MYFSLEQQMLLYDSLCIGIIHVYQYTKKSISIQKIKREHYLLICSRRQRVHVARSCWCCDKIYALNIIRHGIIFPKCYTYVVCMACSRKLRAWRASQNFDLRPQNCWNVTCTRSRKENWWMHFLKLAVWQLNE